MKPDLVDVIKTKYGSRCKLYPPISCDIIIEVAEIGLPGEIVDILAKSNGIDELMTLPNANGGEPFVSGRIIYSFDEIKAETEIFREIFREEGTVFAGDGAGGYYVLKPDGRVYYYEYIGEAGECCAESLNEYFSPVHNY